MSAHPDLAIYSLERGPIAAPQFVAFFTSGSRFLPVHITGDTEAEVRRKAEDFWAAHGAKHEASDAPAEVPAYRLAALEKARATRAANKAAKQTEAA